MLKSPANTELSFDNCRDDFTGYLGMTLPRHNRPKDPIEYLGTGLIAPSLAAFKDQIIVDLGAGISSSGYQIAQLVGAKHYIGVERFNADRLQPAIERIGAKLPFTVVKEDMLTYLQSIQASSVSIIAAGIDTTILQSELKRDAVAAEIERVLHPEGVFLSVWSDIMPKNIPVWRGLKERSIFKVLFFSKDLNTRIDLEQTRPGKIEFGRFIEV
jgi:ubiquinone/menaquinone biosynthesis C-methylase UbiE